MGTRSRRGCRPLLVLTGSVVGVGLVLGVTVSAAVGQDTRTLVAYSMAVARMRVEEAQRRGADFRREQLDVFRLGGITRPWAAVIDADAGDWILVGEADPAGSPLTLDDWAVALRARFIHVDADPGVTMERRPSDRCLKAGIHVACPDATRQDVRFFGGIDHTHFGRVCLEADLLIKRIGLGLETVPVAGLKSYRELIAEELRRTGGRRRQVASRFWFYPMVHRAAILDDVVLVDGFHMRIFTEVVEMTVDGKPVRDGRGITDAPSEAFSRSFNEHFEALAAARPVLDTLRGLTRLAALAKGLRQLDLTGPLDYYLQSYAPERVATPSEYGVITPTRGTPGARLSGGVALAALATRVRGGDATAFKRLVLAARPAPSALSWRVTAAVRDGRLESVKLPSAAADASGTAALFARALFLQQQQRYDAAVEAYSKVLSASPDPIVSAYLHRGQVYTRQGRYDLGIADYAAEIALHPRSAEAYTSRGAAWGLKGDADRALADHDRAIVLHPFFAVAYNNRGVTHSLKRQYGRALVDFDRALALDGTLAEAYVNRGIAAVSSDPESAAAWARAALDFDRGVQLAPLNAHAYYWRALARLEQYDAATSDLDIAIALDAALATPAYFAKAQAAEQAGRSREAEAAYRKFLELAPTGTSGVDEARQRLQELRAGPR